MSDVKYYHQKFIDLKNSAEKIYDPRECKELQKINEEAIRLVKEIRNTIPEFYSEELFFRLDENHAIADCIRYKRNQFKNFEKAKKMLLDDLHFALNKLS